MPRWTRYQFEPVLRQRCDASEDDHFAIRGNHICQAVLQCSMSHCLFRTAFYPTHRTWLLQNSRGARHAFVYHSTVYDGCVWDEPCVSCDRRLVGEPRRAVCSSCSVCFTTSDRHGHHGRFDTDSTNSARIVPASSRSAMKTPALGCAVRAKVFWRCFTICWSVPHLGAGSCAYDPPQKKGTPA